MTYDRLAHDVENQNVNIEELSQAISKLADHVEKLPTLKENTLRYALINLITLLIVAAMFIMVFKGQSDTRDTLNILKDCTSTEGECRQDNLATIVEAEDSIALKVKCQTEDLIIRVLPQAGIEFSPQCVTYFEEHPSQLTSG